MVVTVVRCSDCQATSRDDCTCDWKVRIGPDSTLIWAFYKARAYHGSFLFEHPLIAFGLTLRGTEKRIRRVIRRHEKKRLRAAKVKEFTIERGK